MRFLFDICHPAHAHFFRNPIETLQSKGHDILVTSRRKEVTTALLDQMGFEHTTLSEAAVGKIGLLKELFTRNLSLLRVVKSFRPDCMAAIGGIFISHVGFLTRTPSLVFYDTENARIQNMLTYPFASLVIVPRCYEGSLPRHSLRYPGYHELSYLHPSRFNANRDIAIANGLDAKKDTFFIRLVAWKANHDIGEQGWDFELLDSIISYLIPLGKIIISSERKLPDRFRTFTYNGNHLQIHHLMAFCKMYIGESATMASESVILGVPAIYAAHTGRGYTNEQERLYDMARNVNILSAENLIFAIREMLNKPQDHWKKCHNRLIESSIDVTSYVSNLMENYASSNLSSINYYD